MKNFSLALSGLALFFTLVFSGCSSSEPGPSTTTPATKTLKEKITGAKWKVKTAYEENSPVYELGSATNKSPNYSKFILDFTNPVTGKLTEVDDSQYSFTLSVDELKSTLSLSAITPSISGGDYSYTATFNANDTEVTLVRSAVSPKSEKNIKLVMVKM